MEVVCAHVVLRSVRWKHESSAPHTLEWRVHCVIMATKPTFASRSATVHFPCRKGTSNHRVGKEKVFLRIFELQTDVNCLE